MSQNHSQQIEHIARQMALIPIRDEVIFVAYTIHTPLFAAVRLYQERTGHKPTRAVVPLDYDPGPKPNLYKDVTIEPTANQTVMILLTHEFALFSSQQTGEAK